MKYVLTMLLVAAIGAVLLACGGGGDNQTEPTQPTPAVDCKAKPEACK